MGLGVQARMGAEYTRALCVGISTRRHVQAAVLDFHMKRRSSTICLELIVLLGQFIDSFTERYDLILQSLHDRGGELSKPFDAIVHTVDLLVILPEIVFSSLHSTIEAGKDTFSSGTCDG
eukprot:78032-Amorphochlora_amoeboformis.AAC.3